MIVEVEVGGRVRRVELSRGPNGWVATVEGRSADVSVAQSGHWSSLTIAPSHASYEIAFDDRGRGELIVHVDGVAVPVSVVDRRRAFGSVADAQRQHEGPATIVAPMAGRIVKVLVSPGDQVTARQGLVVVEAMKMENELRAPADGRVAEVRVAEGMSVEARTVLVTLE